MSSSTQPQPELLFNHPLSLDAVAGTRTDYNVVIYKIGNQHFHAYNNDGNVADKDLDLLSLQGTKIPIEDIRPLYRKTLKLAPSPLPDNVFIKTPCLAYYKQTNACARNVLREVNALERFRYFPHPNLATYHGCIVEGNRIASLVFERYKMSLSQRLRATKNGFMPPPTSEQIDNWCCDIEDGLDHLHNGMGLVHLDLDPRNVMLDAKDRAIIIDFDSCLRESEPLGPKSHGTAPWILEQAPRGELADRKYDMEGLRVIRKHLEAARAPAVRTAVGPMYSPSVATDWSEETQSESDTTVTIPRDHVPEDGGKMKRGAVEVTGCVPRAGDDEVKVTDKVPKTGEKRKRDEVEVVDCVPKTGEKKKSDDGEVSDNMPGANETRKRDDGEAGNNVPKIGGKRKRGDDDVIDLVCPEEKAVEHAIKRQRV